MATQYTMHPHHRQHMEGVRDALHGWLMTTGVSLGPAHPMVIQLTEWRDEITLTFVEVQAS